MLNGKLSFEEILSLFVFPVNSQDSDSVSWEWGWNPHLSRKPGVNWLQEKKTLTSFFPNPSSAVTKHSYSSKLHIETLKEYKWSEETQTKCPKLNSELPLMNQLSMVCLFYSLCACFMGICVQRRKGKGFLMMRFGSKMNRYKISKNLGIISDLEV